MCRAIAAAVLGDATKVRFTPLTAARRQIMLFDEPTSSLDPEAVNEVPQELPDPIPFPDDTVHASYDLAAVGRWWRAVQSSAQVM